MAKATKLEELSKALAGCGDADTIARLRNELAASDVEPPVLLQLSNVGPGNVAWSKIEAPCQKNVPEPARRRFDLRSAGTSFAFMILGAASSLIFLPSRPAGGPRPRDLATPVAPVVVHQGKNDALASTTVRAIDFPVMKQLAPAPVDKVVSAFEAPARLPEVKTPGPNDESTRPPLRWRLSWKQDSDVDRSRSPACIYVNETLGIESQKRSWRRTADDGSSP